MPSSETPAAGATIQALDEARVSAWMAEHVAGVAPPVRAEVIAAGRSNLTFRITDVAGSRWALRRPPTGPLLPTAHDVGRECRIMSALAGSPVPVPAVAGFCDDESVTGVPFLVMDFVDGVVIRDEPAASGLSPAERATAARSLVDTLVALHDVVPAAVGLGDLGRPDGYVERQLRRWRRQLDSTPSPVTPSLVETFEILSARVPEQSATVVAHGDYKIDNVIVGREYQVAAILDWELCTLGDPLADVGMLMAYWRDAGEAPRTIVPSPTALEGFPSRSEVVEHYATATGRAVDDLDYYVAWAYWKLTCIAVGVHARMADGSGGGDRSGIEGAAEDIAWYADQARERAGRLP